MKPGYKKLDHTLLLFLVALFLFNSPFSDWWMQQQLPWYTIFIAWAFIIVLVAINQRRRDTYGD